MDDITIIDTSIAKKQAEVRKEHELAESADRKRAEAQTLRIEKAGEHVAREAFERAGTATLRTKPPQGMEQPERAQRAPAGDSVELGRVYRARDLSELQQSGKSNFDTEKAEKAAAPRIESKRQKVSLRRQEHERSSASQKFHAREMIERGDKKAEVEKKLLGSIEKKDQMQKEMLKSSRGLAGKEKPAPLVGSQRVKEAEKANNKNLQKDKSGRSSRRKPDRGR